VISSSFEQKSVINHTEVARPSWNTYSECESNVKFIHKVATEILDNNFNLNCS